MGNNNTIGVLETLVADAIMQQPCNHATMEMQMQMQMQSKINDLSPLQLFLIILFFDFLYLRGEMQGPLD